MAVGGNGGDAVPATEAYAGRKVKPAYGHVISERFDTARRALQDILGAPAPSGASIGEVMAVGNKALFALQVLDGDTEFGKQTITISVGGSGEGSGK
jgi:hypothetical protein